MIASTPERWLGWRGSIRSCWPGATSQCAGASPSDGDPSASRTGAVADVADQYGAGTNQVLRGAAAGLQSTQYESEKAQRLSPELQAALKPLLAAIESLSERIYEYNQQIEKIAKELWFAKG